MDLVLAHGGAAGALAEAIFLAVPVVVFLFLSRWAKRKAAKLEAEGGPADDEETTG
jgi:UDP:flavonoid glycosyltransferase YjiC (YdhE family)